ncbi:MAG: glycine--tRNA ligase [Candidatus Paceibacterota bacterium]
MDHKTKQPTLEGIVALAKRRGFVYPGSEIYGGLAGTYDYGPLGVALKNNIKQLWWKRFVDRRDDMYGVDAAILMNRKTWEASGHAEGFADPLVEDTETKQRYRADHLLEDAGVDASGMSFEEINRAIREHGVKSPDGNELSDVRAFNMMFETTVGAAAGESAGGSDRDAKTYLRPETAQGIFTNFKNVVDSLYPDFPFGIAQIGKAFRNEIAPREFIFRLRELEQMEVEYFIRGDEWEQWFEYWRDQMWEWIDDIGLAREHVHELEVPDSELAHYSKRTIDFEFDYPNGKKELYGLAYRTDHDLRQHMEHSGVSLEYTDKQTGERFVPHVIEPSLGVDRTILALLCDAYREDTVNEETRTYLAFKPEVAPVRVAVFPLLRNKPELVEKAKEVYKQLKAEFGRVWFDDNGNIGKRYRRQDEIGTPHCVTIDFDTLEGGENGEKDTVTIRDRDTGKQERVAIAELKVALSDGR